MPGTVGVKNSLTYLCKRMFSLGRLLGQTMVLPRKTTTRSSEWTCHFCQHIRPSQRFSTSARAGQEHYRNKRSFGTRLRTALQKTKVQWKYRIPVGLGIGFLGIAQFYRVQERERKRHQKEQDALESSGDSKSRPRKRKRIRPSGPW